MNAPTGLVVTLGAVTLNQWCGRCNTSSLATAGVYTLNSHTGEPERLGIMRYCILCDEGD